MASPSSHVERDLVEAAREFWRVRPWTTSRIAPATTLEVPGETHPVFAFMIGPEGQQFALGIMRGEWALERAKELEAGARIDLDSCRYGLLGVLMASPGEIDANPRGHGKTHPDGKPEPFFFSRPPKTEQGRAPNAAERRTLLYVLRALLVAHAQGRLPPIDAAAGEPIKLTVSGAPAAPDVAVGVVAPKSRIVHRDEDDAEEPEEVEDFEDEVDDALDDEDDDRSEAEIRDSLREISPGDATWVADWVELPIEIEDDPRPVYGVLVGDEDSGLAIEFRAIMGGDVEEARRNLFSIIDLNSGPETRLPKRILFVNRAFRDASAGVLAGLGVECAWAERHPLIADMYDTLLQQMAEDDEEEGEG